MKRRKTRASGGASGRNAIRVTAVHNKRVVSRAKIRYKTAMNAHTHTKITRDPKVMMGKPVIAGTRVPVEAVVRQFAAGADMAWVLQGFPDLGEDDVRAALEYAAECVSEAHAVAAE